MKKMILPVLALLLCVALLTACGTAASENGSDGPAITTTAASNDGKLLAEVANISGNKLTLKVLSGSFDPEQTGQRMNGGNGMERPERGDGPRGGEDFTFPEGMSRPERGNRPEGGPPPEGFSLPEGYTTPEGIPPRNEGDRPAPDAFSQRYTGEEKEVAIPDGTPVVSISFSDGAMETKQSDLISIKTSDTVQLVYDGERIIEVRIIDMSAPGRVDFARDLG